MWTYPMIVTLKIKDLILMVYNSPKKMNWRFKEQNEVINCNFIDLIDLETSLLTDTLI